MAVHYVDPRDAHFGGLWKRHFTDPRRERAFLSAAGVAGRGAVHECVHAARRLTPGIQP